MDNNFIALINKSLEIGKDSVVINETLKDNPRFDSLGVLMVLLMLEEEFSKFQHTGRPVSTCYQ
jgi:acyl carrier protein